MNLKILIILCCVLGIGLMVVWFLVPKFLEQPSYSIIKKEREFEIRRYEAMLLQSVNVSGDQYSSLRKGFRPLVSYIGGKKRDGVKISMTAPVFQALGENEEDWVISFSMPSKYTKASLPNPSDDSLFSEELNPSTAAVIRFNGKANEKMLLEKTEALLDWLQDTDYLITSRPKYMFYNDPSTPGFLRRNEVMVLIK